MRTTYKVLVTERFVNRFTIEADSPEEAEEIATEMAIHGQWDAAQTAVCERTAEVEA
jgi:hypothetical protein